MTGFAAKMHQIRFPLGLRPRPAVSEGPTSKGTEGEGVGKGRGREWEESGGEQ